MENRISYSVNDNLISIRIKEGKIAYNPDWIIHSAYTVGLCFELGIERFRFGIEKWSNLFADSRIAELICEGDISVIIALSGIKKAVTIAQNTEEGLPLDWNPQNLYPDGRPMRCFDYYAYGEFLTWYQWFSNMTFREILDRFSPEKLFSLAEIARTYGGYMAFIFSCEKEIYPEKYKDMYL